MAGSTSIYITIYKISKTVPQIAVTLIKEMKMSTDASLDRKNKRKSTKSHTRINHSFVTGHNFMA